MDTAFHIAKLFRAGMFAAPIALVMTFASSAVAEDAEAKEAKPDPATNQSTAPANALENAISGMRDAEKRIFSKDAGTETRKIQKKVIDDLEALIRLAEQQSSRQSRSQSSQSQSQSEEKKQDEQQQSQNDQKNQTPSERDRKDNAADSQERSQKGGKGEVETRDQATAAQVWGHLPARLRQRLRNIDAGKTLPKYNDLVRRYFESLAEQGQKEQRK